MSNVALKVEEILGSVLLLFSHDQKQKDQVESHLTEFGFSTSYCLSSEELSNLPSISDYNLIFVDARSKDLMSCLPTISSKMSPHAKIIFVVDPDISTSKVSRLNNLGAYAVLNAPLHPLTVQMHVRNFLRDFTEQFGPLSRESFHNEVDSLPNPFLPKKSFKQFKEASRLFYPQQAIDYAETRSRQTIKGYFDLSEKFKTPVVIWSEGQREVLHSYIKEISKWRNSITIHNPDETFRQYDKKNLYANLRLGPSCAFSSVKLIQSDFDNYELKIEYPSNSFLLQRRAQMRSRVLNNSKQIGVTVNGKSSSLVIKDISRTGICLIGLEDIPTFIGSPGTSAKIEFEINGVQIKTTVKLLWSRTEQCSAGFEFKNLSVEDGHFIESLVFENNEDLIQESLKKLA